MTDDQYGVALLRPLQDEPRAASRVDLARAVRDGRRLRGRSRLLRRAGALIATAAVGAAGVVVATATGDSPFPQSGCVVRQLPLAGGLTWVNAPAADPTGRFVVASGWLPGGQTLAPSAGGRSEPGTDRVIRWNDGRPTVIVPPGGRGGATDVNSAGTVVGVAERDGPTVSWVYRNGRVDLLPGTGWVSAVNAAGVMAGSSEGRPALWLSPTQRPTVLPLPPGAFGGDARDIDDDGTVVGVVWNEGYSERRPYVWLPDGPHRQLPMPAVTGADGVATQVRNGWVAGGPMDVPGRGPGFVRTAPALVRWHLSSGTVDVSPDVTRGVINARGWVAGLNQVGDVPNVEWQYTRVIRDGTVTVLPALTPPDPLQPVRDEPGAVMLSDDGRTVVGQSRDRDGRAVPVVWRCAAP